MIGWTGNSSLPSKTTGKIIAIQGLILCLWPVCEMETSPLPVLYLWGQSGHAWVNLCVQFVCSGVAVCILKEKKRQIVGPTDLEFADTVYKNVLI